VATQGSPRTLSRKLSKIDRPARVVGGIGEIPALLRPLSHQAEISVTPGVVVSHDQLMDLRLEWFVRQPRGRGPGVWEIDPADRRLTLVNRPLRGVSGSTNQVLARTRMEQ
jgi:hypothetical protein